MGNLNVETFDFRSFTAALARARKAYRTHCAPTQYLWSGPHADRVVKSLTNSNYYTTWRREPTTEPQRNGREVAFYHAIEWCYGNPKRPKTCHPVISTNSLVI